MCKYAHMAAFTLFWLAAACLGPTTQATAQVTRGGANPRVVRPGDVDVASSRVYIFVGKSGLIGHEHAVEGKLRSGAIQFGANRNAGQLVFDMNSFDADTPAARRFLGLEGETDQSTRRQVNDNMLGSAVLDVKRFPTATFTIESALPLNQTSKQGHPLYQLDGQFTLHGKTNHVRIVAETIDDNGATRVRGRFKIKQSDYGMTPFSKAFGAIGVADELGIYSDIRVAGRASVARR